MERSAELLVGNGRLITQDDRLPYIENGCVAVRDGLIAAVGTTSELRHAHRAARFVDAQGGLILPGLVSAHTHLCDTFARGLKRNGAAPRATSETGGGLRERLEKALTLDTVYWSAVAGMLDCVRNGVTTIFDHHSSPNAIAGSLFRITEAACQTGVRSCLSYGVSEGAGEQAARGIAENRAHLEFCRASGNHLHRGLVGLDAPAMMSSATLGRCAEMAAEFGAGFHVGTVRSGGSEREQSFVGQWREFGIAGAKTLAAGCTRLHEEELALLAASRTNIVHSPGGEISDAGNAAPVLAAMRHGARVGLGTGGQTADLFEAMRTARLLMRQADGNPDAGWCEPPQMLFRNNAAIASECFGRTIGKLVPGAVADVIVADYAAATPFTAANLEAHLLLGMSGRAVKTTIIGGEVLMEDRAFLTLDEREAMAKARAAAAEVWKRM